MSASEKIRVCSEINFTRFRRIFAGGQGSGAVAYPEVRKATLTQPSGKKTSEAVKFISEQTLSIIVPVYNVEKYIEQCVESLLRQTHGNIEILLINDGSTDGSLALCEKMARRDSRIVVLTQENQGVSVARNNGLSRASGNYITFVDADDWVEDNMCERALLTALETTADVVIWSYYRNLRNSQTKDRIINFEPGDITSKRDILQMKAISVLYGSKAARIASSPGAAMAKLYKKTLLHNHDIKFVRGLTFAEDTVFSLYAFENAEKIIFIDECLYHYRKSDSSATSFNKYMPDCETPFLMLLEEYEKFIQSFNKPDEFKFALELKALMILQRFMVNKFYHSSNPQKQRDIRKEIRQIIKKEPFRSALASRDNRFLTKTLKIVKLLLRRKMVFTLGVLLKLRTYYTKKKSSTTE